MDEIAVSTSINLTMDENPNIGQLITTIATNQVILNWLKNLMMAHF